MLEALRPEVFPKTVFRLVFLLQEELHSGHQASKNCAFV
jgi:hypothetical protein